MANDLFDKIMGKVPVVEENSVEEAEALPEREEAAAEPAREPEEKKADSLVEEPREEDAESVKESAEEALEPVEEPEEEENHEPQAARNDVEQILDKMLGKFEAGSTKPYVKPKETVHEGKGKGGQNQETKWRENEKDQESTASVSPSQVILIDLVLDNTISMKLYYRTLYDKLYNLVNGIYKMARKSGFHAEIRYGITYIRDTEPIVEESFSPDGFTKDVLQIMEKLNNITFSGGADNGRENINGAIRTSLHKLHSTDCKDAKCGILLFTDSLPEEEDMCPDFMDCGDVRFAHCFVNDDRDYLPLFRPVDHDGKTDSRLVNVTEIRTLESFLNEGGDNITLGLISEILEQVSVSRK